MSAPFFDLTGDKRAKIAKEINDTTSDQLIENQFIYLVKHDKADPTKFRIISDSYFDDRDENGLRIPGKMEGVELTFADPLVFKQKFPELAALPPVHLPPNTVQNPQTGKPEGIQPDEVATGEIKNQTITDKTPNPYLKVQIQDPNQDIGALWIAWKYSEIYKSGYTLNIGVSNDGQKFSIPTHLKNVKVPYDPADPMKIYNLSADNTEKVKAKYLLIQIVNDKAVTGYDIVSVLDVLATFRVTKSTGVQ